MPHGSQNSTADDGDSIACYDVKPLHNSRSKNCPSDGGFQIREADPEQSGGTDRHGMFKC